MAWRPWSATGCPRVTSWRTCWSATTGGRPGSAYCIEFKTMAALGIRPFPMVYRDRRRKLPLGGASQRLAHRTLGDFQRWAVRRAYVVVPFEDYDVNAKGAASSS